MKYLSRLTNLFSRRGRDDESLLGGLKHAKAGRYNEAIEAYNSLIKAKSSTDSVRARALFNRALAHSAQKHDTLAVADLKEILLLPNVPDNVRASARSQLMRVNKRSDQSPSVE